MGERFEPAMKNFKNTLAIAQRLNNAAENLKIATLVTEQYPRGLGHTSEPLLSEFKQHQSDNNRPCHLIEKTKFSMVTDDTIKHVSGRKYAIVCGMETHVCVLQTCLDLLECNIRPFLCVDGVESRSSVDKDIPLRRLDS